METNQYRLLVEEEFGPIVLPKTNKEIESILEIIDDSMESVSEGDYRLFQAMEIINAWRKKNDCSNRRKNNSNDE